MKEIVISILCLFSLPVAAWAQKSVSDLAPAHASALQEFLTTRSDLDFLSETRMDQNYLKQMRKDLGARLTPFYRKGDFNGDGRQDFALILGRDGRPKDQGTEIAASHRYRYPLTIVIFNGTPKGDYKPAFTKDITAPLVCFLNTTGGRKKRLSFGVYETDEGFTMTPSGKGYIAG